MVFLYHYILKYILLDLDLVVESDVYLEGTIAVIYTEMYMVMQLL